MGYVWVWGRGGGWGNYPHCSTNNVELKTIRFISTYWKEVLLSFCPVQCTFHCDVINKDDRWRGSFMSQQGSVQIYYCNLAYEQLTTVYLNSFLNRPMVAWCRHPLQCWPWPSLPVLPPESESRSVSVRNRQKRWTCRVSRMIVTRTSSTLWSKRADASISLKWRFPAIRFPSADNNRN